MDITYVPMARGFVYLAAVVDWFSRRVLSWRVSITMEVEFCLEAVDDVKNLSQIWAVAPFWLSWRCKTINQARGKEPPWKRITKARR